eukprot:jgi/Tetstr1/427847/TSEL_017925.t1
MEIADGEVVGLVGESGCGKSTLGRVVAGVHAASDGKVYWRGKDVSTLSGAERRDALLKIQMIFQDPMSSLNPRMRVRDIVGEAPRVHGLISAGEVDDYVDKMLLRVGLDPDFRMRYPHQFSGGQRQRIGIARALAVEPDFLVCDESIAALDVSIQAQVLNLFMDLREDLELFAGPNHPYAQALLDEVPRIDTRKRVFQPIKGEIPSPINPPKGCHFHPRCPHAFARCREEAPALREIAPGRLSACHLNDG